MKKIITLISTILLTSILLTGCQIQNPLNKTETIPLPSDRTKELHALSVQFTQYLDEGSIDEAMGTMDETMIDAMDGKLADTWSQLSASLGAFVETGDYVGMAAGDYDALEMTIVFEKGTLIQRTVFDSENRISGLFYRNGAIKESADKTNLPKDITETDITVDSGEGFPLSGKLTMPKDGTPVAAIVLIHGSGPSDMNETIGLNAPFSDIAYKLAQKKIAVLRYDKRTYTHGTAMAENGDSSQITIEEEVINDALAAVEILKSQESIDKDHIYLLGHSMGGGLLSYINSKGADCAGYIVMAGTPRSLWELSAEQNLLIADELEKNGDADSSNEVREFVTQEKERATALASLNNDETVFGMPVTYLRNLNQIHTIDLHLNDKLPILILQGEKDRQVTMTDFHLWKEGLANHPISTYISYPSLNHLFGEYTGEQVPFSELVTVEYAQKTPVPDSVINDIADWICEK